LYILRQEASEMGMAMKDVRDQLSDLVKRAAYRGERITFGPNHGDDVTLIATEQVRRMEATIREMERQIVELRRGEEGAPHAFTGLQRELRAGRFSVRREAGRARRVLPDPGPGGPLSREERVRLGGGGERAPEFRRSTPRA
jgi:hypothetical protein